jgi:hypothetical protein
MIEYSLLWTLCRNPLWFNILDKQAGSWGLNTLRRDILAEKFVTKIFKDGVRRHMADPKVPSNVFQTQ